MRAEVLSFRVKGWSFPRIARELGISQGWAYKLYKVAMRQIVEPGVQEVRDLELARLDDLTEQCYNILDSEIYLVSGGKVVRDVITDDAGKVVLDDEQQPKLMRLRDYTIKLAAMDRIVKIGERRARILGLDAPYKTSMTDPTGTKALEVVQVYLPANGRDGQGDGSGD